MNHARFIPKSRLTGPEGSGYRTCATCISRNAAIRTASARWCCTPGRAVVFLRSCDRAMIRRAIGSSCSINAVAGNRPRTRVLNRTPHRIWSPKSRRYERTLASGHGRWLVAAGGATLAMAEASTRSDRVTELVLRGIFMIRKSEIDWFYQSGASQIFSDVFAKFAAPIPVAGRGDRLAAYHLRLVGPDGPENTEWACAWSRWEGTTIWSLPDPDRAATFSADHFAAAFEGIECHYFQNGGVFAQDG